MNGVNTYVQFKPHNFDETAIQKWEEIIGLKLAMRPVFFETNGELQYSRVAVQLLGIEENEYEMQEYLYTITNKGINWTLMFDNMPKLIDPQHRTEIVNILQIHQTSPLSINRFMAFFAGKQLLPLMDTPYRNYFVNTLKTWLEFIERRYPRLQSSMMQRILLDFVKWANHYFPLWLEHAKFESEMPKVFWYGPAKESEVYFLYFLYLFGCDVVVVGA